MLMSHKLLSAVPEKAYDSDGSADPPGPRYGSVERKVRDI